MSDYKEKLLAAVEQMPAFPKSVHDVLKLTSDVNSSQKELVEVIKNDPVFTLKMLRLLNSPFFGLSKEITSIHHASVYLGQNTLKNIALGLAAVGAIPKGSVSGMDMGAFWLHSLAVASGAKLLAVMKGVSSDETSDFFAAGLLHDLGKVVMALYMPDEFSEIMHHSRQPGVNFHVVENEVVGTNHTEVGAMLAEKWNLPEGLREAIARHHEPDEGDPMLIVDCVYAADQISKKLSYGTAGNFSVTMSFDVTERLGMGLQQLIEALPGLEDEIDRAKVFIKLGEAAA